MPTFNFICVHCGGKMKVDVASGKIKCTECGAFLGDEAANTSTQAAPSAPRKAVTITHRGEINAWARAAFDTAHDYLNKGANAQAMDALQRALDNQANFADAHLWIAKLSDDEAMKRDHLGSILAEDPTHAEATRLLMVLNGRLTAEQAARSYHYNDQQARTVEGAVSTKTTALLCPICSGHLTVDEASNRVQCRFCGYTGEREESTFHSVSEDSLTMALIEKKANPVRWVIGERLLHCNECGAERTIPARTLSMQCPFCGSNQVIVQDALGSFRQPDGLIPFSVSRQEAAEGIKARLGGMGERLRSMLTLDKNDVKQALLDAVYMPFWVFDSVIDVTKTTFYKDTSSARRINQHVKPSTTEKFVDMLNNVPIAGAANINLVAKINDWDMSVMQPYTPQLLAKFPAQLYSIDFDKAALDAHSVINHEMRARHSMTYGENVSVTVFSAIRQMTFQLALLPVWVATLIEVDGDTRTALVNGQSGKVALGETQKHGK
ncbi:MAG: hypothetical protein H7175_04630 [Burkholderiales bacterium]|nr:hypothetical protein [Anaerolineae bacterium]